LAGVTISFEPDEVQGLTALADVAEATRGRKPDVTDVARTLLHDALAARLEEVGLPWAPSPDAVRKRVAIAAKPRSRLVKLLTGRQAGRYAASVLTVAVFVVLWGGYVQGWQWTGFRGNNQVWDWLQLLLLPVLVGTIPLWIRHADDFTPARRKAYLAAIAVVAAFVAVGYLIPWRWTGFPGHTLWDWFTLLLLPAAVVIAPFLSAGIRSLRSYHKAVIIVLALAWAASILGGYDLGWRWTGYQGNTLWDWLQLLLLPLVVPTLLVPVASRWVSGAAQPAPRSDGLALGRVFLRGEKTGEGRDGRRR
jgi:hypothetical protein